MHSPSPTMQASLFASTFISCHLITGDYLTISVQWVRFINFDAGAANRRGLHVPRSNRQRPANMRSQFTVRASVLPSPKVLQHATTNASKLLIVLLVHDHNTKFPIGKMLRNDKIGSIKEGGYADLIVLDANPLDDVTILDWPEHHLLAVIKEGRVITSKISGLQPDQL